MNVTGFIWREDVIDKLVWKHQIEIEEVVEVFYNKPRIDRLEREDIAPEKIYIRPWGKLMMDDI